MLSLYLHIPFCARRCRYCDFNSYAGLEDLFEPYAAAISREILSAGRAAGRPPVGTIFIGGGTPTVLPPELLAEALDACRRAFDVSPDAEITCEANPGTTDRRHYAALRYMGVNRLSLGVQSFDDDELRWLGRIHSAADAGRAFADARSVGFDNISLDLIFGLPAIERATPPVILSHPFRATECAPATTHAASGGSQTRRELDVIGSRPVSNSEHSGQDSEESPLGQRADSGPETLRPATPAGWPASGSRRQGDSATPGVDSPTRAAFLSWQRTLDRAVAFGPEHLSLYGLTVEPGTPLGRHVRRGEIPAPDDDLAADLYLAACETLAGNGYTHYEISNWAKSAIPPNPQILASPFTCRHNLVYWRREPYLGFGAGAHSFDGDRRGWNVRAVARYIERMAADDSARSGGERIDRRLALGETMMLGLRLLEEGVPDERFRAQFGLQMEDAFGAEIAGLVDRGLVERMPDRLRLTPAGVLLGNRVFAEFMDVD